jgi:LPS O-antigen subunit length determinant protein (WzzB/FepE family)
MAYGQEGQHYPKDEEVNLLELWDKVLEGKKTVALTTLIVMIFGIVWAFLGPKTYEVTAAFLPPMHNDVAELNFPDVTSVSTGTLYKEFSQSIVSPENLVWLSRNEQIQGLFGNVSVPDIKRRLEKNISLSLPVEAKEKSLVGDSLLTQVTVDGGSAEQAYVVASLYIGHAIDSTKQNIKEDLLLTIDQRLKLKNKLYEIENIKVNREIEAEISRLKESDEQTKVAIKDLIQQLRKKEKLSRQFQIERLEEDYTLAKKLGITQPIDPLSYNRGAEQSSKKLVEVTNVNPSRYWLGTNILQAEIKNLKGRKNDDAFIPGMANLQQQLQTSTISQRINALQQRESNLPFSEILRGLKFDILKLQEAKKQIEQAKFDVVRVVEEPLKPVKPVKPYKTLILAVSAIFGFVLGVLIVLVRQAVRKHKSDMTVQQN